MYSRLSKAPPSVTTLIFKRDWIDSGNIGPAVAQLNVLKRDGASIMDHAGTVALCFEGFGNDQRALHSIPEARAWFARLTGEFPYWLLFCERTSPTIPLVFNLLLESQGEQRSIEGVPQQVYSSSAFATLVKVLFQAMNMLCHHHGIDWETVNAWSGEIADCLQAYVD